LIDGTVGFGGHSLAAMETGAKVMGIDRDSHILKMAKRRFDAAIDDQTSSSADINGTESTNDSSEADTDTTNKPYALHHGSYADISPELLQSHSFPSKVDGILLDLGMNTHQIENPSRGFTFRKQGPLDMRFDANGLHRNEVGGSLTAYEVVNTYTVDELASIFDRHADEPYAHQIAQAIVNWRNEKKKRAGIISTLELRYIIEETITKHCNTKHRSTHQKDKFLRYKQIWSTNTKERVRIATKPMQRLIQLYEQDKVKHANHVMRCFQAIRIETNDELNHLNFFLSNLSNIHNVLTTGARLVTIAFQPGEDSLVQCSMEKMVDTGEFRWLTPIEEGLRPTLDEVKVNGKSRTARLRAVEKK
jgi:16S rRNA (cytosine1402-N4)-methyltransferase